MSLSMLDALMALEFCRWSHFSLSRCDRRQLNYVAISLACTAVLITLAACSWFSPSAVQSLKLAAAKPAAAQDCPPETALVTSGPSAVWCWAQIAKRPFVYRRLSPAHPDRDLYLTGLKSCGSSRQAPPLVAIRELLVGFKQLQFLERGERTAAAGSYSYALVSGQLDNEAVLLTVFSFTQSQCQLDQVLWFRSRGAMPLAPEAVRSEAAQFEEFLAAGPIT